MIQERGWQLSPNGLSRDGKKWSDPAFILKVETAKFGGRLDVV